MFRRRPLIHHFFYRKLINHWLGGLAYRTKWLVVVCIFALLSLTQLPEIFAQEVTQQASAVSAKIKRQRVINLYKSGRTGTGLSQGSLKSTGSHLHQTTLSGVLSTTKIPFTGTGSCVWDMSAMQRTGVQVNTGLIDYSLWTGDRSGFNNHTMGLSYGTGILLPQILVDSGNYLMMNDCIRSGGQITYPGEEEYLSGLILFSGELLELPHIFEGVQLIISSGIILHDVQGLSGTSEVQGGGLGRQQNDQTIAIPYYHDGQDHVIQHPQELLSKIDAGVVVIQHQKIKRSRDTGKPNKLQLYDRLTYLTPDETLSAELSSGTVIFTAQGQELQITAIALQEVDLTPSYKKDDQKSPYASDTIEWGTPGDHLIFTQPIMITYQSDLPDGSPVQLQVQHAGQDWSTQGLSLNSDSQCDLEGNASLPGSKTSVQGGQITFYTCGASLFNLIYTGGASSPNFADNGTKDFTGLVLTGVDFPTGSVIADANILVDFRPIDNESPTGPWGTTNCYPNEKSFQLIHPDGTTVALANAGTYTTPNTSCPQAQILYDQQASSAIVGGAWNLTGQARIPVGNLSTLNGKSPFGTWTLRMGDSAGQDGVVLFGFNLELRNIECGDGIIETGEVCDDSNAVNGDGCSLSCQVEAGWQCSGQPSSCSLIPAPSGLRFHLDGSKTGALFADIAGSGFDATAFNGVTTGNQNGETVMCFNGTNQYLERATNFATAYPFTMSTWVRANTVTGLKGIVSYARSTATNIMYNIELNAATRRLRAQNTTARYANGTTPAVANDWFLVTAVYTSATSRTIYVNGVQAGTNATNVVYDTNVSKRINIGRLADSTPTNYFAGCVDDVRFYTTALNSGQVYGLYAKPAGLTTSLVTVGSPLLTGTIQGTLDTILLTIDGTDYTGTNHGDGTWSLSGGVISPALSNGSYVTTMLVTNPYGRAVTYTGSFVVNAPVCGNGTIVGAEQCDDGNTINGDGCSNICQIEPNWSCVGSPSICTCANMQMDIITTGDITYSPYWGGFTASASVTNASASTITSRCVTAIGTNYSIVSNYNSTYTVSGSNIIFCNVGYNGTLAPGASTTFGFNGDTGFSTGVQSPSHSSIQGDVTYSCQPPITGTICIESPDVLSMTGTQGTSGGIWEAQFDYFQVQDSKGINSGYYTTLSMTTLSGPGGSTIGSGLVERKGDPITTLSGTSNPRVVVGSAMSGTYTPANVVTTFIKRDTAANSNVTGEYGSRLWLKVSIPPYQAIGLYTGTITYTLYEN